MDARSGSGNVNDRKNRQNVRQRCRAVSTQPDRPEGQGSFFNELAEGTSCPDVQGVATSLAQTSSSASSTSDRGGGTSTSAGRGLSLEKSTLNPHSKELKFNANARSFVPFQTPTLPSPIADNSLYYPPMTTATRMHGMPSGVGAGPSFAAQQPVMYNPPAAPMPRQIYNQRRPQYGQQMTVGQHQPAVNRREHGYSHFVSLPLVNYPALLDKLVKFQNTILGITADDSGIEKSIFIKPTTFHLTVLMLKLWRVQIATEVLQSVSSKVMDALENRPLSIRLKGLDCMRGSKAEAFVLYAPVEEIGGEGRLLRACKVITDAFVDAGMVDRNDVRQLKLHATLMNTRHRKRKTISAKDEPFDARGIFELYGNEEWGEYCISEAHLSQMSAFDENGYYHCCASIPFPENISA